MNTLIHSPATILVVDDTPANLQLLTAILTDHGYDVRPANSGRLALAAVQKSAPDLVLLDVSMPDMDGYEVCRQFKADEALRDIPILFISAHSDTDDKVKAFRSGGVDYITKPFQMEEVLARVSNHLTLYRQKQEIKALRDQDRVYYEKLAAMKDEVMHTVTHDLKNPIGVIKGAVGLMQMEDRSAEDTKMLGMIERNADRMLDLVSDLLEIATLETGGGIHLQPDDLCEVLISALEAQLFSAEKKNIDIQFECQPTAIPCLVDAKRMGQVLTNLLSNAIKYTPEGGTVALRVTVSGDCVLITVEDNGLGIPPHDIPHLFDKFYRVETEAHLAIEGTGLGLSIVKSIVEHHRGSIWVESELGKGSCFYIELPLGNTN